MKRSKTNRQIMAALKAAARLNTSQGCPDENHAVVVLAMDAIAAIKTERCAPRSSMQPLVKRREELAAIRRVLTLVDGYMSTQPQDLALAWDGGIMTYGELRNHLQSALKTLPTPW